MAEFKTQREMLAGRATEEDCPATSPPASEPRVLSAVAQLFPTWGVEPESHWAEVSPRAAAIFGFQTALFNQEIEQLLALIDEEDCALLREKARETIETGTPLELEVRARHLDGSQLWVWITGAAVRQEGKPVQVVGHYYDVTERRKALLALEESEARFRRLIETASVGINIGDLSGGLTYMNPSLLNLLGYTKEEVENGQVRWNEITPSEYAQFDARATEQLRTSGTCQPYEKVYLAKDGRRVSVLVGASDISEAHSGKEEIAAFVTDLTQLKQTELALHRSRIDVQRQWAELETIYRTAPVGLSLFSINQFRYLRVNDTQAHVIGLPVEQIIGKPFREIAPNLAPHVEPLFQQVLTGKAVKNVSLEGELPAQPGVRRYWTVSYSPVFASNGSVQAISAVIIETTSQKRAEQALIQSEKLAAVGRLASSISHEINNPLEAVTNLIYIAATSPGVTDEVSKILHMADKELQRVSQIASQTLRFHRQSTKPARVTPAELLKPVTAVYQGRLANSDVSFKIEHLPVEPIECLENEIRQVLNNLIGNALDATKSGGTVLVRSREAIHCRTGQKGIRITVGDTGCGMNRETQRRIFEAFYTTKGIHGTGLGLWISKGIVDKHKGKLRVYSSNRDGRSGTVFALFLPRNQEA